MFCSVANHDEAKYSDAEKFKPERWLRHGRKVQTWDQYDFQVFFAGPRICIGKDLALYEAKMVLVAIIQSYKLELLEEDKIYFNENNLVEKRGKTNYDIGITCAVAGPLKLKVTRRE